jgi:hypothetical protein
VSEHGADFVHWLEYQAALLRRVSRGEAVSEPVDWINIIEELKSLARRDRQELRNCIVTILDHLMRLQAAPANHISRGWRTTIVRARDELEALLRDSPSLRLMVPLAITAAHQSAQRIAAMAFAEYCETPTMSLDQLSYTEDQVLGPWLPVSPHGRLWH